MNIVLRFLGSSSHVNYSRQRKSKLYKKYIIGETYCQEIVKMQ